MQKQTVLQKAAQIEKARIERRAKNDAIREAKANQQKEHLDKGLRSDIDFTNLI